MKTRTYLLIVPVRLAVEADSPGEARPILLGIWQNVADVLPVGASTLPLIKHVASNTVG